MIYTNVKTIKERGVKAGRDPDEMIELIRAARVVALDCETMAASFSRQAEIDRYLIRKQDEGKKVTAATRKGAEKHAEDLRGEMALDHRRSTVRLVQAATEGGDVLIFDMREMPRPEQSRVIRSFHGKSIIGQNLKFDLKAILAHWPWFRPGEIFDVMIGHKIVMNRQVVGWFRSDLATIVRKWAGEELKKEEGGGDWSRPITIEMFRYAALDVAYLHEIMEKQARDIEENSQNKNEAGYFQGALHDKVACVEMKFVEVLAHVEMAGMPVNAPALRARLRESSAELVGLKKKRFEDLNTQSHAQIIKFLDDEGIETMSASKDELVKYIQNPLVADLLRVKTLQKEVQMIEDYLSVWTREDGRIYSSYNQYRGQAGRMSSSDPNAQQIPRALKTMFYLPTRARGVTRADYPSIEARVMGVVAQDEEIIRIFRNKEDMHLATSSAFLHKPESEVTKDERLKGKYANFGFMFGMGPLKFTRYAFVNFNMVVTLEEAEAMRRSYLGLYKGVRALHKRHSAMLEESREIVVSTLLGRQVCCDKFTNANNYPVQGSAADMLKLACVIFFGKCRREKIDARIINLIHDEIVIDYDRRQKKLARAALKGAMETAANYVISEFSTEVELEDV